MNYEKVSVNIDDKKLAQIDLLVENNFYSNRSEFINLALQECLNKETKTINMLLCNKACEDIAVSENLWFIGVFKLTKSYLLKIKDQNIKVNIKGFGVLSFAQDCDEELIIETIASISKKIKVHASDKILNYYNLR